MPSPSQRPPSVLITRSPTSTGRFSVTAATLTITADNQTNVYDATLPTASTANYWGFARR